VAEPQTIVGRALENIPWQDRPAGCSRVMWRYDGNPVIPRDLIPCANSIFNSAVVPFGEAFAGVFRVDDRRRRPRIHAGRSRDGLGWQIDHEPIRFVGAAAEVAASNHYYDPRVVGIDGRCYVTWCNDHHGPTIGIAWTDDFRTFHQLENAFLPANRNGVLFPRRIGGNYAMLSRPSDWGHTPFGDIFYSESPDMEYWGRHRHVMARKGGWEGLKIGAGPVPIETTEGWLVIYHGVLLSCNGYVYSCGAALLDLDEPWKVRSRCSDYLLSPQTTYECVGDTPNVVFPCAALADAATGRVAVYYGAADTVTCLAFCQVDELIDFIKDSSEP
jgi:beta-1,4-mannooligosaccharide/beta-1,4-mannosyl-N-acetylglucosamine phosphorylase